MALPLIMVLGFLMIGGTDEAEACEQPTSGSLTIDPSTIPDTVIEGYGHEQLVNAAYIIQAGKDLGLEARDQTIGVMTAMGESSLTVLDYGDAAGPDSRGLFQQRDNGAWGSLTDRMDPYISATNFFTAMMAITDRDTLAPTIVAHNTQRNADPYHYEKYWDTAVTIVETLAGATTGLTPTTGCQASVESSSDGWALPTAGVITSSYGWRVHPVTGLDSFHGGTDLAGGCDAPIYAASAGIVTFVGFDSGGNGTITIDHGGGIQTKYLHEYQSGMLVTEGQTVTAGALIGTVGSSGMSTGCHLHYMILIDGETTDPETYMADHGITLG